MLLRGDPRTFDREIYARLSRPERWAATRRYVIRIGPGYRRHPKYPDDEAPASVARHSILLGEFVLGYLVAASWMSWVPALLIPLAWADVAGLQSADPTWVLVVCWTITAVCVGLIVLRGRQINHWFVERYPELDPHPFRRPRD